MNEKKKLQARDFITIGIFTAILWVVQMVIMYLGFLSPLIVAGYAVLIPIVTGHHFCYSSYSAVHFRYGINRCTYLHCRRTCCRLYCKVRQL